MERCQFRQEGLFRPGKISAVKIWPLLVLGDLNTAEPADDGGYVSVELELCKLQSEGGGTTVYPPVNSSSADGGEGLVN